MANISEIEVQGVVYDLKDKEALCADNIGNGFEIDTSGKINNIYRGLELINSYTINEDIDKLEINKDSQGNPFELTCAMVRIHCDMTVASGKAVGNVVFSTPQSEYYARAYSVGWSYPGAKITETWTRASDFRAVCDIRSGYTHIYGIFGDDGGAASDALYFPADQLKYDPNAYLIKVFTTFAIPKNAQVFLYGVRKVV